MTGTSTEDKISEPSNCKFAVRTWGYLLLVESSGI